MARPRKDQGGPSARERIEQAYWETLAEKPLSEMSVREIAERARVNHNTFYYHYANVEDVAEKALLSSTAKQVANMLQAVAASGRIEAEGVFMGEEAETAYARIRLVLRNGTTELIAFSKAEVFRRWLSNLGLAEDDLSEDDGARLEFAWGGLTSLICCEAAPTYEKYLRLLGGGIADAAGELLRQMLKAHGKQAGASA